MLYKGQQYFDYDDIPSNLTRIRLLTLMPGSIDQPICCDLTQHDLEETELHYSALSYTWGQPESGRWIWVNDCPFRVQPNLKDALHALRDEEESMTLWVDAICINQAANGEKSHQVNMMGQIYRSAIDVIVWPGSATAEDEYALAALDRLQDRDAFNRAIQAVADKPYWDRAWIRQEVLLGRSVNVRWGKRMFSLEELTSYYALACSSLVLSQTQDCHSEDQDLRYRTDRTHTIFQLAANRNPLYEITLSLEDLLYQYGNAKSTDTRDRVYSLLSLASDCKSGKVLTADYSISKYWLALALMHFCRPKDPLLFGRSMATILQLKADEMRHIITRKRTHEHNRLGASSTNEMAFNLYDRLQDGITCKQDTESLRTPQPWAKIYTLLASDKAKMEQPLQDDRFYQIGASNILLAFRPHLIGCILMGFVKRDRRGDLISYRIFHPALEYDLFKRYGKRMDSHLFVANSIVRELKRGSAFSKHMNVVQDEINELGVEMISSVLEILNNEPKCSEIGHKVWAEPRPKFRLDARVCKLLLESTYGVTLAFSTTDIRLETDMKHFNPNTLETDMKHFNPNTTDLPPLLGLYLLIVFEYLLQDDWLLALSYTVQMLYNILEVRRPQPWPQPFEDVPHSCRNYAPRRTVRFE